MVLWGIFQSFLQVATLLSPGCSRPLHLRLSESVADNPLWFSVLDTIFISHVKCRSIGVLYKTQPTFFPDRTSSMMRSTFSLIF